MSEKSITFVVPVYKTAGLFLNRCLHSLLDNQDYPHKDVIVVFDGNDQMQSAYAQEGNFKDDKRVKFIHIEHGGAPKARNAGAREATGDYICFFDCDSVLRAGGIRTWIETFEEHPEVGFVYGGYRFFMKDQYDTTIPAQDFDPWLLTCNNYISSMNPIKREHCLLWDESLKGLQDWDFWLRVVKSGIKGHKIDDILVLTQPPTDESISGNSHKNWEEIFDAVREKNNIVGRDAAIYSFGAPYQAKRRAKFINADYRDPQMLICKPHHYKAVISMGYYVDTPVGAYSVFGHCNGSKKIIHWIGTDVMQLQDKRFRDIKHFSEMSKKSFDHQFSNAPWLQEELKEMGIETELLYCPIDSSPYFTADMPEKFTLAVYRSDSNPVHNEHFMFDVARSCPDIDFKFFGGTPPISRNGIPDNIDYVGTISDDKMPEFIGSTSGIVRVTFHDGYPATLAEWAMSGRPFICNIKDMPHNRFIDVRPGQESWVPDKETTIKAIRELQREVGSSDNNTKEALVSKLNEARSYFKDLLAPDKYIKRMNEVINA